jgi:hypothetical protein
MLLSLVLLFSLSLSCFSLFRVICSPRFVQGRRMKRARPGGTMNTPRKKSATSKSPSPLKAKPSKTICLAQPPNPETNFYISTDTDVEDLLKHINKKDLALVRGPPATGKTTLAQAICRLHPYDTKDESKMSCLFLSAQDLEDVLTPQGESKSKEQRQEQGQAEQGQEQEPHDSKSEKKGDDAKNLLKQVQEKIIRLLNSKNNLNGALKGDDAKDLTAAFSWLIKHNVAIVADEAHIIFNTASDDNLKSVCSSFLKHGDSLTAVFFSTTSETVGTQGQLSHSPAELSKRFFWAGQFVVDENLEAGLKAAGVLLSKSAAIALANISGLHRGVFAKLCHWVEQLQTTTEVIVACC